MKKTFCATIVLAVLLSLSFGPDFSARSKATGETVVRKSPNAPKSVGKPTFVSPHSSPIAVFGDQVFVVNTPADTVDVIDPATRKIAARISVGIDPVGIAVRPDGKEVWVSNHISDSVSVIDSNPSSDTYLHVIATIQDIDPRTKATRFDEPVGIAFAGNAKAYVALSSENQIAVVDVASRRITKRLSITAQDPRAIEVRGDRLYVIPFESNNKTQLSGGTGKIDGQLVTFNAHEHSIANNNVLSLGHVLDIVKHPKVPDRDLYVFDTKTDQLVEIVDTLGTLQYGLTVDSNGRVFVAQTDARNEANGRSGTKKHGLKELENRAFLNRITTVDFKAGAAGTPKFIDLEPLPPQQPKPGEALATPFAIEVTNDDSTLVVSAAGSDKLITIDASNGTILGRVDVGAVPRGIALEHATSGQATQAWVLNAVANSVSLVDLSDTSNPQLLETIPLEDPTHPVVKRGRIAFNTASASTTGTFSCASCHPDGHTDQLLWVLKTPIVTGGDQIMPRSTMPIRGLRDTAPFHWDGIPGDPYGGNNSANIHGSDKPNSNIDDPTSTTRNLIDGGLAATMSLVGDKTVNDEGKAGQLSARERDDMAVFLLSVPYPPAQRRAYDNVVSETAEQGFKLFHIDGDLQGKAKPNVCGNCHRMPFLVSTNTPGTGMDAPTWRGAYDRFLILPQGRLNIIDFDFYRRVAERGIPERSVWRFSWAGRRRFDPVWDMVLEGSTGYSGSLGRQVTLSQSFANDAIAQDMLTALEVSASEGAIVLEGEGVFVEQSKKPVALQFDAEFQGGSYIKRDGDRQAFTRGQLVSLAKTGKFVGTFSARHGAKADVENPQPAIWTLSSLQRQSGRQKFPILHHGNNTMRINGRHITARANIVVDGRRVSGSISLKDREKIEVLLKSLPAEGMHLLQIQNESGLFSNDFIFHVTKDKEAAAKLQRDTDQQHVDWRIALSDAIRRGDVDETKNLRRRGTPLNQRRPGGSSLPLSIAARTGNIEIVNYLLKHKANVNAKNRDGSTSLHTAAFFGRIEIVKLFLKNGGSAKIKNRRGDTPIDVVAAPWSDELERSYKNIARVIGLKINLDRIKQARIEIAKLLRASLQAGK